MRRGEIWRVAGGAEYTGKPPPVAVLQDDRFAEPWVNHSLPVHHQSNSRTIVQASCYAKRTYGLKEPSSLMVDKLTTVPKAKLGKRVGSLNDEDIARLNRATMVFLGFAGASSKK